MSESENGQDKHSAREELGRISVPRSASPAKRTAVEMESGQGDTQTATPADSSIASQSADHASGAIQDSALPDSLAASSVDGSTTANTSATSLQSEDAPASLKPDEQGLEDSAVSIPDIDAQVGQVYLLLNNSLSEGDRCAVVSSKWLRRVLSRISDNLQNSEFSKQDREGPIGPLDNSDIVPDNGFRQPILKDNHNTDFIPLKTGCTLGEDMEALPYDAYGLIVGWYGAVSGQKPITRYAHDTAPRDALQTNVQYELYPPIFTVRKLSLSGSVEDKDRDKSRSATLALKMKAARKSCGQLSPDDALRLVSSRFEKYQTFLGRAKDFAGIPEQTKVRTWRALKPTNRLDLADDDETAVSLKLSVGADEWKAMEAGVDIEDINVKDESANSNYNGKSNMDTYQLFQDQILILEELSSTGDNSKQSSKQMIKSAAKQASTSGRSSPAPSEGMITRGRTRQNGKTRGTVGLQNLGNTCYMNSALQCIRSVEELAIYFLHNKYKPEINNNNPLGHKGAMANRYAEVLQGIYKTSGGGSFSPSSFKSTLGRIMPTFSGFGQQDSQEFLSFLVDALHEDLNRIQSKPYRENPDSDDKRVNDPSYIVELGEIYRKNHHDRNDSIAMDLFSGFYKNTMECPVCDKVSVTFDPYSSLTLQLPVGNTFSHTFIFVPRFGKPARHDLDYERSTTVREVKNIIASKHEGVDPAKLWMVEVYQNKIYKHFEDSSALSDINLQSNDYVYVYELDHATTRLRRINTTTRSSYTYGRRADEDESERDVILVPIYHRHTVQRATTTQKLTLYPGCISLSAEDCKDAELIEKKVILAVAQMTTRPIVDEVLAEQDGVKEQHEKSVEDADAQKVGDQTDPSEDEYVNVSIHDATDAATPRPSKHGSSVTPTEIMSESFVVPQSLLTLLFSLNFARGATTFSREFATGFDDRSVKPLSTREATLVDRASSVSSSRSDDGHSSSLEEEQATSVTTDDADEADEADDETMTQASDATLAESTVTSVTEDTIIETTENPDGTPPAAADLHRRPGKTNKFKNRKANNRPTKRKDKAQAKLERKQQAKAKRAQAAQVAKTSPAPEAESGEDPALLLNGECIILDWYSEAYDGLFGGSVDDAADMRGHAISDEDGSGFESIDDPVMIERREQRVRRKKFGITLEDCFVETGKREKLSEDNAWYCNRCKELRQATKTLEIWTLPDILVLHLKRFGGNRRFNDKIDVMVDYPVEGLNLNEKVGYKDGDTDYTYDLFAVDNHFGGLGGGHYTAVAKNFFDGEWYDYNDSMTSKQGEAPRRSAAAYLLFYRRRSTEPLGPPYLQDIVRKFHNPEDGDESDLGEDRLGDPSGTLPGSSSGYHNKAGAGAATSTNLALQRAIVPIAAASAQGGVGLPGQAPQVAGLSQMQGATAIATTPSQTFDDEGISMDLDEDPSHKDTGRVLIGPQRPQHLQVFRDETPGWGFANLSSTQDSLPGSVSTNRSFNSVNVQHSPASSVDDGYKSRPRSFADDDADHDMAGTTQWNDAETAFTIGMDDVDNGPQPKSKSSDVDEIVLSEPE